MENKGDEKEVNKWSEHGIMCQLRSRSEVKHAQECHIMHEIWHTIHGRMYANIWQRMKMLWDEDAYAWTCSYVTYQDEWTYKHAMKWEWGEIRSEWTCYNAYEMVRWPINEHISKHDEHWCTHNQIKSNKQHKKFNFEYMIKTWQMDASLT